MTVSPDGRYAYVGNKGDHSVSVISTREDSVIATITVGKGPDHLMFTPDGKFVYTANTRSPDVSIIDATGHRLSHTIAVGNAEPQRTKELATAAASTRGGGSEQDGETVRVHRSVAMSSDGKLVFVPNPGDGTVSIIDHANKKVLATIATGDGVNNLVAFVPGQKAVHHAH